MDALLDLSLVGSSEAKEPTLLEGGAIKQVSERPHRPSTATSPDQALEILKEEPDYDSLASVLRFLGKEASDQAAFSITRPSPESAKIVQVLVSEIIPNYWTLLKEDSRGNESGRKAKLSEVELLQRCLRSITGINAILVHLRALIQEARSEKGEVKVGSHALLNIGIMLDALCSILEPESSVQQIWRSATEALDVDMKRKPLSQEILAVLGGGRLLSVAAEADQIVRQRGDNQDQQFWAADAQAYTRWLGCNIVKSMSREPRKEEAKFLSNLVLKALRLGHSGKHSLVVAS